MLEHRYTLRKIKMFPNTFIVFMFQTSDMGYIIHKMKNGFNVAPQERNFSAKLPKFFKEVQKMPQVPVLIHF